MGTVQESLFPYLVEHHFTSLMTAGKYRVEIRELLRAGELLIAQIHADKQPLQPVLFTS